MHGSPVLRSKIRDGKWITKAVKPSRRSNLSGTTALRRLNFPEDVRSNQHRHEEYRFPPIPGADDKTLKFIRRKPLFQPNSNSRRQPIEDDPGNPQESSPELSPSTAGPIPVERGLPDFKSKSKTLEKLLTNYFKPIMPNMYSLLVKQQQMSAGTYVPDVFKEDLKPLQAFKAAIRDGKRDKLAEPYWAMMTRLEGRAGPALQGQFSKLPDPRFSTVGRKPPFSIADLRKAMNVLSGSPQNHHLTLLQTFYGDISKFYNVQPIAEDHRAVLASLAYSPSPDDAVAWLQDMPSATGDFPQQDDFHIVLDGFVRIGDMAKVKAVLEVMRSTGIEVDRTTFHLILKTAFVKPQNEQIVDDGRVIGWIETVVEEMERSGFERNFETEVILLQGFNKLGVSNAASTALRVRQNLVAFNELSGSELVQSGSQSTLVDAWNGLIQLTASTDGLEAGLEEIKAMRASGVEPTNSTLDVLMITRPALTLSSTEESTSFIESLEEQTGLTAGPYVWGSAIKSVLIQRLGTLEAVEEGYDIFIEAHRNRNVTFQDPDDLYPLVQAICYPRNGVETNIEDAMDIQHELLRSESRVRYPSTSIVPLVEPERTKWVGADDKMLQALAQGVATTNDQNNHSLSLTITREMHRKKINTYDGPTTLNVIMGAMNISTTYQEAYEFYTYIHRLNPDGVLSVKDYTLILNGIASLKFPPPYYLVPRQLFTWILEDLRFAGHVPTAEMYGIIISHYVNKYKAYNPQAPFQFANNNEVRQGSMRAQWNRTIKNAIEHIHSQFKIDTYLTPTTEIYETLQMAFLKIDEPELSRKVWEDIINSRSPYVQITDSAVTSYFISADIVGGEYMQSAVKTYIGLREAGYQFKKQHYDIFLHALARQGTFKDAFALLGDMGKEGRPEADRSTITAMLNAVSKRPIDVQEDLVWGMQKIVPEVVKEVFGVKGREEFDIRDKMKTIGGAV